MAGKIIIDTQRCKGCGLCVAVCPKDNIVISKQSNNMGYFPANAKDTGCTGCTMCALICPEAAIKVLIENNVVAVETARKAKATLTEEKV